MSGQFEPDVLRLGHTPDERLRPVSAHRKKVGSDIRIDATRVSGPVRLLLEPLLWISLVFGGVLLLIARDPALRQNQVGDVVIWEHALPLAVILGALLVISAISALIWVPVSTVAVRSRAAFSGFGMIGAGIFFTRLHPVETQDFQQLAWFCTALGVFLVVLCAVPWPTRPAQLAGSMTRPRGVVLVVLLVACAVVGWQVWQSAGEGLVGVNAEAQTGWNDLLPLMALLVALIAAARQVSLMPPEAHREDHESDDVNAPPLA